MNFNIEITDNELKYIIEEATKELFKQNFKSNFKQTFEYFLSDKELLWNIGIKATKELIEKEIKNIMKQNNLTIIQIMREEVSKICKDSLEEMRLLEMIAKG
jgi:hypothetical protein